jgi:hypothetical protein
MLGKKKHKQLFLIQLSLFSSFSEALRQMVKIKIKINSKGKRLKHSHKN